MRCCQVGDRLGAHTRWEPGDYVPDEVYEQVRPHFTDEELANLTLVIATINAWNRFGISFRDVPGCYKPAKHH